MNVVMIILVVFTTLSVTLYCVCFLSKHFKAFVNSVGKYFAPTSEKEIFDAFISFEKREIEKMEKDYTQYRISIRHKFISKLQQEIEEMEEQCKSGVQSN